MQHVLITDQILTGNLFQESGYDEYASANKLAKLMEQAYREQAAADHPGAEIEVTVDVKRISGHSQPLEIIVTDTEDEEFVDFPDTRWYAHQIENIEFDRWAIELCELEEA